MFTMMLLLVNIVVFVLIEDSVITILYSRLPDLPYCMGDPIFHPLSHASRKESADWETKPPVFD